MPSPFPGMDPYLEDPSLWRGVHHWMISATAEQPQLLPRGLFVDVESRIWLEEPERAVYPDLALLKRADPVARPRADGGTLVADEPVRVLALESEVREDYQEIYETSSRRLITRIEFISPSNKVESQARELYIRKRRELSAAGVSLVEIDLLRAGRPIVRLPEAVLQCQPELAYVVNIVRARTADYEFHPVSLRSRLPRVGVPLREGESDAAVDLQAALDRVYLAGGYEARIDYGKPPAPPPLSAEATTWLDQVLRAAGFKATIT